MPKVSINIIKDWFKNQSKPPQEQFWAWLDSFWHKDEPIPQSAVQNLVPTLQKKADLVNGMVPEDQLPFSVVTSEVITLGTVSLTDNVLNLAVHSSGANKVRVKGKTITRTFENNWNTTPIADNGVKVIRGYAVKNEDDFFISEGDELPEFELPEIPEDSLQLFIVTITNAGATIDTGGEGGFKTKAESGWKSLVFTSNLPRWIVLNSDESVFDIIAENGATPLISGLLTKGGKWIYPGKTYGLFNASGIDVKIQRNNVMPPSDPYQLANYLTFQTGTDVTLKPGEYFWFKIKGLELVVLNFAPDIDLSLYALDANLDAEIVNRAIADLALDGKIITEKNRNDTQDFLIESKFNKSDVSQELIANRSSKVPSEKAVADWFVSNVVGGYSDGNENGFEIGLKYKDFGVNLIGGSNDSLNLGIYEVKSNSNCVSDANKLVTKVYINLATIGALRFCIGTWANNKFTVRWLSDIIAGTIVGWNSFSFQQKIFSGEILGVFGVAGSSAMIKFGNSGKAGNRFVQYSTVSGSGLGQAGSYYSLYYETYDYIDLSGGSSAFFNLPKSIAKVNTIQSTEGFRSSLINTFGDLAVNSNTDQTNGYAINKVDFETTKFLSKIEVVITTAGNYTIVTGFLDQFNKFIEKSSKSVSLIAGINTVNFNTILEKGDYVGFKFPGKMPYNSASSANNLFKSSDYTSALTLVANASLGIKLYHSDYIAPVYANKTELQSVKNDISVIANNFLKNGGKVKLIFNPDGTVSWTNNSGFSKILHLGNSLAIHPVLSYWWGTWGMAASEQSKDYVHVFLSKMQAIIPTATSSVRNIAAWETNPGTFDFSSLDDLFVNSPDLIVIRLGENATWSASYKSNYKTLIEYIISKNPTAKILIGGVFWASANKDADMKSVADEKGIQFIKISDLDTVENKSFIGAQVKGDDGQWHTVNNSGVANHPGDLGMERIATVLFNNLGL